MKTKIDYHSRIRFMPTLVIVSVLVMAFACAGPYGRIKSDPQVLQWFESNTVPKEYHYYYDGRSDLPFAIIGLKPEYTLVSRLWQPVEPNTPDFARKVRFIYYDQLGEASFSPTGSLILDAAGQPVGIWYSRYRSTGVVVQADKQVRIYSPYHEGSVGGAESDHPYAAVMRQGN